MPPSMPEIGRRGENGGESGGEGNAESGGEIDFMSGIRDVIIYSGLDFDDVLSLPCDLFLLMRKNKIIEDLSKSEEGRRYLDDCERMNKTDTDYDALKKFKEKEGA